ncbi:carbohydrate ABC transporter permease [Litorilinea aerophila]|uniref:Carbohydrate ABC transporter permease n=1 Tax=Litorilinea aerophila TaxID=1204385 RepID=A0A540VMH5_9CHLR|nr:carbohydrate ABC transporter permease [Litorilinea aerophila]MCC9074601.1 carbohydrate ABC transporter permease [Litorilinea aerophila]GIV75743.1 MAG: sugar ABC transporter permease [Litorilinea sp.]
MTLRTRQLLTNLILAAVLVIMVLWVLFPFYWAFLNSIKHPADTFENSWIPFLQFQPTLEHWRAELAIREIRRALWNSTVISIGAATLAVALGTLAAYALARFRFHRPQNGTITTWFLSQRVLPPVVVVIPFFLLMRQLRLLDSVWALVMLNATFTLPFPVIILSQMFRELPVELEEAALVDGASRFQAFYRVALPLVVPGLVATWIICMAFSWNEFLFALALTTKNAIPMPVIIAGAEHTRGVQFWFVGVRVMLTMLPPTILALLAQRYIIRGLTLGAVKG